MVVTTLSVLSDQLLQASMTVTTLLCFQICFRGGDNDHVFCAFRSVVWGVRDSNHAFSDVKSAAGSVCDSNYTFCVFRSAAMGVSDNDHVCCFQISC